MTDRRPQRRRPHHYVLMVAGWPLLLTVTVVLLLRWRGVDEVYLVALVALTPFLLAPIAVATVVAWFSRSMSLRAMTAAVAAAWLFTVAPFDALIGCRPSEGDDAITIMTANVLASGGRPEDIAANIAAVDPDVVLLQEINARFMAEFFEQPVMDSWAYRSNETPNDPNRAIAWSKWPLSDVRFNALDATSSVQAVVEGPTGPFTVASIHAASPISADELELWREQYAGLSRLPTGQPMVIGGDFNATEDHRPFRHLLDQGWTDVHDNKGCGPDMTWPTRGLPFPVMRLDHILVTDHFEVLSTDIGDPGGSDHYPVISRIQLAGD